MTNLVKLDPRKFDLPNLAAFKRQPGSVLLGLALDGSRLEGVALRRTNGSVEVRKSVSVALSLDPLTNDPELVGREIRKHLEAAGIRDRWCTVCLPLNWALTLSTKLPDIPQADLPSFLQIEAERGFPYALDALLIAYSQYRTPAGEAHATIIAVPRDHVSRLEAALKAAHLRPVSFSFGIAALQPASDPSSNGVIALCLGGESAGLQVSCDGGVAVLRTIEGAFEHDGSGRSFHADQVAREVRITLGQLPPGLRESARRLRVFGQGDDAEEVVELLGPRLESFGISVEFVRHCAPGDFTVRMPSGTPVSPALSLAARHLAGQGTRLEFLPPKVSAWTQLTTRYSSRKLVWASAAAAAIALIVGLALLYQQWQLSRWRSKWTAMAPQVGELEAMQQQIRKFRPWFDDSFRSLSILRQLTEAFPEDGAVAAKTVEIREAATVTCSGTARDHLALLKALDRLRAVREVSAVQVEQIRGKSPMQFTFNFHWGE